MKKRSYRIRRKIKGAFAHYFLSLILSFIAVPSYGSLQWTPDQTVHGKVFDTATGNPVPFATVWIEDLQVGTAADIEGLFSIGLEDGTFILRISAVGYESKTLNWTIPPGYKDTLMVGLDAAFVVLDEVLVSDEAAKTSDFALPQQNYGATEDLLQRVAGLSMVQRANFAWEPTIRGMSGGQVGLVIDGMKVYGACVDKMDPASSYVEPENLEKLEISKGGFDLTKTSQLGGTINLVTERPAFDKPVGLEVASGFESVSMARRVRATGNITQGPVAVRASVSYRKANNFAPGGTEAIPFSGFEKRNYKVSVAGQLARHQHLTADFIGDDGWNIGYPVLLMDARLARARIYSLNYHANFEKGFLRELEARAYRNEVNHWMDDRDRDVMQREVMRGMFMPMYGNTETIGGISTLSFQHAQNQFGLTLDAHEVNQFGDMWMYSLFPNIPDMYLLNMGDVRALNTAATLDYSRPFGEKFQLKANGRLDWSLRTVEREEMISIFRSRYDLEDLSQTYSLFSASLTADYMLQPVTRIRIAVANGSRLPTNIENYGHYVYNYVDGYFYTGNPRLKPETSRQAELTLEHVASNLGLRVTGYYNSFKNYIIGVSDPGIDLGLGGRTAIYRFRVYENTDKAYLFGSEASLAYQALPFLEISSSVAFAQGQNLTLNEPLPMIPPLSGAIRIRASKELSWVELESRWAIPQNRVSSIADEDRTDGYTVFNIRGGHALFDGVTLTGGVENILDTYYQDHLSIGNLPSRGRNIFVSASLKF